MILIRRASDFQLIILTGVRIPMVFAQIRNTQTIVHYSNMKKQLAPSYTFGTKHPITPLHFRRSASDKWDREKRSVKQVPGEQIILFKQPKALLDYLKYSQRTPVISEHVMPVISRGHSSEPQSDTNKLHPKRQQQNTVIAQ